MPDTSLLPDRLDLDADLDRVADQDAAGLQRDVPGQAEVGTADARLGAEGGDRRAERIDRLAVVDHIQLDRARRAADRQVADDAQAAGPRLLDPGAGEGDPR